MLRLIQYYVKNVGFVHIYDEICAHPNVIKCCKKLFIWDMDKDIIKRIAFCNITTYLGQMVAEINNS